MTTNRQRLAPIILVTVLLTFALLPVKLARAGNLPATGQTTPYPADKNDGISGPVAVPDDGALRRGALPHYKLLKDGTVKDLNTGLIWEVKCTGTGCPVLHDVEMGVSWSADIDGSPWTIWEWLEQINAEGGTGYAGHHDWRIPNVRELQSIVDYETSGFALNPIFGPVAQYGTPYWTSTTYLPSPSQAWSVGFVTGSVWNDDKGGALTVRAVRGGPAYHFTLP